MRLHHYIVCWTVFRVGTVLLSLLTSALYHHDGHWYYWHAHVHGHRFWTMDLGFLKLTIVGPAIANLQGYFFPWIFFQNIGLNNVTIGTLCVKCIFSVMVFHRGISWFANDYPCGVCYRGLTICLQYISPLLECMVWWTFIYRYVNFTFQIW